MAMLATEPALVKKAYDIAMEIVGEANVDDIANDVYNELDSLDIDDLYNSSGRTRDGYVDPMDRAWEMFEEALSPFIDEMTLNQKRSLPSEAKVHCIGIIKGLQRYEKESISDLSEWLPDAPNESIITVVEEWKKGKPSDDDIADIIDMIEDSSYAKRHLCK
jgi:hypothetical protein